MRHILVILAKDLRSRWRDRTGVLMALVVPLLLAALMGSALGGANEGLNFHLGLAPAPQGHDERDGFEAWLETRPWLGDGLYLHRFESPAAARAAVLAGEVGAALVLEPVPRVLARQQEVFAARASEALAARYRAELRGSRAPRVALRSPGGSLRILDYFAASLSVLFLNFGVLGGVRALAQERDSGALARLAAAPVHPVSVLLAKFAGLFVTGLLQMAVMIAATATLFGTRWGAPLPVAALVFASVFMAVGLTSLFMAWGGNAERGTLYASIAIFALAVLGGQFMPPQGLPDVFDTLQRLTPNGQAARGFLDVAAAGPGTGLGLVVEPLLYTGAVGVVGLWVGVRRAHDALHRAAT